MSRKTNKGQLFIFGCRKLPVSRSSLIAVARSSRIECRNSENTCFTKNISGEGEKLVPIRMKI